MVGERGTNKQTNTQNEKLFFILKYNIKYLFYYFNILFLSNYLIQTFIL